MTTALKAEKEGEVLTVKVHTQKRYERMHKEHVDELAEMHRKAGYKVSTEES